MRFPIFYDTVSGGGITVIVPRIMPICDDKSEVGYGSKFKQNEEYYKADNTYYSTEKKAIEAWNRRSYEK